MAKLDLVELIIANLAVALVDHANHEHESAQPCTCKQLGADVTAVETGWNDRHLDHLLVALLLQPHHNCVQMTSPAIPTCPHMPWAALLSVRAMLNDLLKLAKSTTRRGSWPSWRRSRRTAARPA